MKKMKKFYKKEHEKVAFFDVDGTIFRGNIIEPLMNSEVKDRLLGKQFADEVHNLHDLLKNNKITYDEASRKVVINWAGGLQGGNYNLIARHTEKFIKKNIDNFYFFLKPLLTMIKNSHDTIICTNEPQFVAEQISKIFGFTNFISTVFEVKNESFTGKVFKFNSTQLDKKNSVNKIITNYKRNLSLAFGDSIGDLGMLDEVKNPICVSASLKLQQIALKKGWKLTLPENILNQTSEILSNQ